GGGEVGGGGGPGARLSRDRADPLRGPPAGPLRHPAGHARRPRPQPVAAALIENAVVHGVAEAADPVELCVRSRRAAGELELRVSDTGPGPRASEGPGLGLGLANTKARLERLHPGESRIEWGEGPSGGFGVPVSIPLRHASAPAPG